jgi:hypothetical protein
VASFQTSGRAESIGRWRRRVAVCALAVALGVAAHLAGGGLQLSCLSVLGAGLLGVLGTLAADCVAGNPFRAGGAVVALLGGGQLAMHLALSVQVGPPVDSPAAGLAPTFGMLAAHAVVTVVLTTLMLGVQRAIGLIGRTLSRVWAWFLPLSSPRWSPAQVHVLLLPAWSGPDLPVPDIRLHPRRGPPTPCPVEPLDA